MIVCIEENFSLYNNKEKKNKSHIEVYNVSWSWRPPHGRRQSVSAPGRERRRLSVIHKNEVHCPIVNGGSRSHGIESSRKGIRVSVELRTITYINRVNNNKIVPLRLCFVYVSAGRAFSSVFCVLYGSLYSCMYCLCNGFLMIQV